MQVHALEIININKILGTGRNRNKVINNLTLKIAQGEVFGFLGPNGAGKSTTIKLLMNFLRPDSGEISILGQNIKINEFRQNIGYLSEFPNFFEHLTGYETLLLSGRLSGVPTKILKNRVSELLQNMSLLGSIQKKVSEYSKGMKQRLGMANALIHDPDILILDEPMSGLDPLGRNLIKNIILQQKKNGKTIFFSSHILSDIEELCDRIGIVHKGHILYDGNLTDFLKGSCNKNLEKSFVNLIVNSSHETHC